MPHRLSARAQCSAVFGCDEPTTRASKQMVMLVCIGAGASHDCLPEGASNAFLNSSLPIEAIRATDAVPPLTKDLVSTAVLQNWHIAKHAACRPLVAWLRRRLQGVDVAEERIQSLEELLVAYRDNGSIPNAAAHLASFRFYIRDLIWSCTEYSRLPGGYGRHNQLRVTRW